MRSIYSLRHIDLVIAFCYNVAGVKPVLRDLGYKVHWVDSPFISQRGEGVKPDMIGFSVDIQTIPREFVPFDEESEDWEIAERLFPKIVEYMHQDKTQFLVSTIAKDIIPMWDNFFTEQQNKFKKQISRVLKMARQKGFNQYLSYNPEMKKRFGENVWQVINSPLNLPSGKQQTIAWRGVKKWSKKS